MKKIVFLAASFLACFWLMADAQAAVRCEQQYGGEVCIKTGELQINKVVLDPVNQRFVDNLDITDHKFAPGEEVVFQLRIKNVGDATLDKVTVSDTLPFFLRLSSGSLSFEITDLTSGETEEREIKARVVEEGNLPQNQNVVCDVNIAEAQAGDRHDKDTAKVCAAKKVAAVTVLPPTGFSGLTLSLVLSAVTAMMGVVLAVFNRR